LHHACKGRVRSGTHVHGLCREPDGIDADHRSQSRNQA
jgi:hypothetical protein